MTPNQGECARLSRASVAVAAIACAATLSCKRDLTLIPGSSCSTATDCDIHPSCGYRVDACSCLGNACYYDGGSELNNGDIGCRSCHGSLANAAPPSALNGASDVSALAVGAHQSHLTGGRFSRPVACESCHSVPDQVDQTGHLDSPLPAEVVFSVLATAGGTITTEWDRTTGECTNYCHGATLPSGTNTTPVWTTVDGSEAACGSCHGEPPGGNHPQDDNCELCHEPTAGPNRSIANRNTHVDGILQVTAGNCYTCHGDGARTPPNDAAPPVDLAGAATSDRVGAHLAHLTPVDALPVACEACHIYPQSVGSPTHIGDNDSRSEVTFGGIAVPVGGTPTPSYDSNTIGCQNTYCHGATIDGGTNGNLATWNGTSAAAACDACHGTPPNTPGHATVLSTDPCGTCHEDTASTTAAQTITVPAFHVDGTIQVSGCGAACHDVPDVTGAHEQHATTQGFACAVCHGHDGSGPQHNEGNDVVQQANVDIVFDTSIVYPGGTTISNGGTPSYNAVNNTCTVGCHNPVPGNPDESPNLTIEPTWVAGEIECRACHDQIGDAPPLNHPIGTPDRPDCMTCHDMSAHRSGVVKLVDNDPTDLFIPALGTIDPQCKGCHDSGGGTFFGGASPPDVLPNWNSSEHGMQGYRCNDCHTYHVSITNTTQVFVDRTNARCTQSGCHADKVTAPDGPFTIVNSHHNVDEGTANHLKCIQCHNPHMDEQPPRAARHPDDKWTPFPLSSSAATQTGGSYDNFCLACHDGSPPAGVPSTAINIAPALVGGTENSQFRTNEVSGHNEHKEWNCVSCHDWHGAPGTSGTNRGRMLLPFIDVRTFPYQEKNSCGTPSGSGLGREWNGQWVNYSFGCH